MRQSGSTGPGEYRISPEDCGAHAGANRNACSRSGDR
jgi:hypothetical protein